MNIVNDLMDARYDGVRQSTYLALDVASEREALDLVERFSPVVDGYKVGLELFHVAGTSLVGKLLRKNLRVFLDVKLHDIPNTVYGALKAICQMPIEMVNVHAFGGLRMMERAREAVQNSPYQPLLIAVTVLTSLMDEDLRDFGVEASTQETVGRLSSLVQSVGLDGVVCSAQELGFLQAIVPQAFERVVPGTRLPSDEVHDQRRIMTPSTAMKLGATRLVIGRAVVRADKPFEQLQAYWDDMEKRGDA